MILEGILNVIYNLFNLLTSAIDIPNLPTSVNSYFTQFFSYLTSGAGILANYTPLPYIMALFGIIIAVDFGLMLYHFVMWVIRKIPMLNVS